MALLAVATFSSLTDRQTWLTLQRRATVLLEAGRAENLIGVVEFQREYVAISGQARVLRADSPLLHGRPRLMDVAAQAG